MPRVCLPRKYILVETVPPAALLFIIEQLLTCFASASVFGFGFGFGFGFLSALFFFSALFFSLPLYCFSLLIF